MEEDGIFDLNEYRRGEGSRVPCPRCSKPIPADATRCPECRVHFQGQAYEFAEAKSRSDPPVVAWIRLSAWVIIAIVALLLAALVVGSFAG
jgi:predicted amidophosphoribosyltransferase